MQQVILAEMGAQVILMMCMVIGLINQSHIRKRIKRSVSKD